MQRTRTKHNGKWRQLPMLLAVSLISIFLIGSVYLSGVADQQDSTKQDSTEDSLAQQMKKSQLSPAFNSKSMSMNRM